jgi:hypothetical protein
MSPTHETRLDDGRGNHRRGSSSWLPRDEAPKQGLECFYFPRQKKPGVIAFSAVAVSEVLSALHQLRIIEKRVLICACAAD